MPNRILREGILTSEKVAALSPLAELFYRKLMSVADDYGRYSANPALLRSGCWPLTFDAIGEHEVSLWLRDCAQAGLLVVYESSGKKFLEINNFNQRRRANVSKWPSPDGQTTVTWPSPDGGLPHISAPARATNTPPPPPPPPPPMARADGVGRNGLVAVDGTGPDDWAERLYRQHPKKKNRTLVDGQVAAIWARSRDPTADMECIYRVHGLWSTSNAWLERSARFCPPLDQWLADQGWTKEPDERTESERRMDTL